MGAPEQVRYESCGSESFQPVEKLWAGLMPFSRAAAAVIGLKVEPTWKP